MQAAMLDQISFRVVSGSEIDRSEILEKENFRVRIEQIIRETITRHEIELTQRPDFPPLSVELKCFGSLSSGFATKASDMDLALLSPFSAIQPEAKGSPIPRLLEKALLDAGIAARLLSKTRVPIIKLCEKPPETLFQRLLEYRGKWEKGEFDENQDEQHDDDDEEQDAHHKETENTSEEKEHSSGATQSEEVKSNDKVEFEVPSIGSTVTQTFYLKQGAVTSLDGYYGLAKRVLRKIGGRDVRNPNAAKLSNDEWEILNRVCEAYVEGLADTSLRDRLKRYQSLSFDPIKDIPDHHSLIGVAAQVEGEHIFQMWEKSALRPDQGPLRLKPIENRGLQPDEAYNTWKLLQQRIGYGTDPVTFGKQVQVHLDTLRKIPTIQTLLLEQGQDETPTQYHQRANKVLYQLRSLYYDEHGMLEHVFISYYVQGIKAKDVRQSVQAAYEEAGKMLDLGAVARKHKSLQLAKDFIRALEKDLVPSEYKTDVEEYLKVLRVPLRETPLRRAARGQVKFDFVVPITSERLKLVERIRQLPDPNILAPSQQNNNRYRDMLEFPKSGAGVQCDINFSAHLALENTLLLRCYSHTDPRVRPMVLFIKHWAKIRGINSGYRGTLSSYGYVLMVLHYLVNVVQPFVCPNLQQLAPPPPPHLSPAEVESMHTLRGYHVQFWRNEEEIGHLASMNQLNHNTESIGHLLRGLFEYYAQSGPLQTVPNTKGFDWGREVVSLRTQGGILTKHAKGWTGAKTVYQTANESIGTPEQGPDQPAETRPRTGNKGDGVKEVRLRYLFAIEDPFEVDHNVARTVTHNGIVSIRDEFRRAWRIIKMAGDGDTEEDLLKDVSEQEMVADRNWFPGLLNEIHGPVIFDDVE